MKTRRDPKVAFFTGAGLSADSGVPTFRGKDGLYANMRAEDILSAKGFRRDPGLVHHFMDDRRVALADVAPNPAHALIARWAHKRPDTVVLTQNIDDLLERAGCPDVVHLHGFLTRLRSIGNSHVKEDIGYRRYWGGPEELAPPKGFQFRCPKTNSFMRPDVILFDELVPPEYKTMYRTVRESGLDDVLVVIGTQGLVVDVNDMARRWSGYKILNNLHPSQHIDASLFDMVIEAPAADAADQIDELLKARVPGPAEAPRSPA